LETKVVAKVLRTNNLHLLHVSGNVPMGNSDGLPPLQSQNIQAVEFKRNYQDIALLRMQQGI